jgi:hypothetical protein
MIIEIDLRVCILTGHANKYHYSSDFLDIFKRIVILFDI